ncbi:uncharacterized protein RJT20DRAFT_128394 [Scheffersomyces xylosifermentans]|uniref:uncharacterized protein n=1 Tax=Scheffersomyces xylosifermentans TaxID=1304137 RepID=UPI00315C6449
MISSGRKHGRSSEDLVSDLQDEKRIKLDNLFSGLSIAEDKSSDSDSEAKAHSRTKASFSDDDFIINPKLEAYSVFKKPSGKSNTATGTGAHFNDYITEKLIFHFNEELAKNFQVLPWYDYRFLVIYRFQRWAVKMFNRFIREYNKRHGTNIRPIRVYDKIVQLVAENKLTTGELFNILLQENYLEMVRLDKKIRHREQAKQRSQREEEEEMVKNLGYDYWDNLKFDSDFDMMDSMEPIRQRPVRQQQKVVELISDESDMEIDEVMEETARRTMESNYGSYYSG